MYYRQPEYYNNFRCGGGGCRFTCCQDWLISWSKEEVDKIINAPNCSEELRSLVQSKIVKTDDEKNKNYSVVLDEHRRCPMLTEDNLCRIQRELGAEYLSDTCMFYPRVGRLMYCHQTKHIDYIYRTCNLSCPEVAKTLISDKKAMNLINLTKLENSEQKYSCDKAELIEEKPELAYRQDIFELFYAMLSNRKNSVESIIQRGAFFAAIIDIVIREKDYDKIPAIISDLKSELVSGKAFKENIVHSNEHFQERLYLLAEFMKTIVRNNPIEILKDESGNYSPELYQKGKEALEKEFGGDDFWLRNIALNFLFELSMPFCSKELSFFENYSYYLFAIACIKLNAIASMTRPDEDIPLDFGNGLDVKFTGKEGIWAFASIISRRLCQNATLPAKLMQMVKDIKIGSPAMLAALIDL